MINNLKAIDGDDLVTLKRMVDQRNEAARRYFSTNKVGHELQVLQRDFHDKNAEVATFCSVLFGGVGVVAHGQK